LSAQATHSQPVYHHADHPEWGRGIILQSGSHRADRLDLSFETGGHRILMKTFAAKLQPADVTPHEAAVLHEKLSAKRSTNTPIKVPRKKKAGSDKPAPVITDFNAQLALFRSLFPGGFQGEKFVKAERGVADAPKKKGNKAAALAQAKHAFREEAFEHGGAEAFEAAATLAKESGFVHPLDGATFATIKAEDRPEFLAALRDLLHGPGAEGPRFDRLVASIKVEGGKRPSWTLATVFGALAHPDRDVCVKPTALQKQAPLMNLPLDYVPSPNAEVYAQLVAITKATEAALKKAGENPRDIVDVSAFISATHSAK